MSKPYFLPADILLPKNNFEKWSVIACDQYTSEPEYWQETEKIAGDVPSAFNIILPEVYLSKDNSARISAINECMTEYINGDIFNSYEDTMIYVERVLSDGKIRKGIIGLIDLEDYSYAKDADTLIRATEETVTQRIPPRVEIRKDASLEIPHIMLLIDDDGKTVIEPLTEKKEDFSKLYDFTLMQNGGKISGYKINEAQVTVVQNALENLRDKSADGLLFAVGDGNHSLATAKECYNMGCGPRYALVEVVNIHDSSLEFEPIYRVMFGVEPEKFIEGMISDFGGEYFGEDAQVFECIYGNRARSVSLKPTGKLAVGTLQTYIDKYLKNTDGAEVDYIHGENSVKELCKKNNTLGFIFDGMTKSELFIAVSSDGSLPRKTFSMGHADDKRFYLEARKIK